MPNKLKTILIKIARLKKGHQRWLIQQLSKKQCDLLHALNGFELLEEASRFKKLPLKKIPIPVEIKLPNLTQELAQMPPLLIAIVLKQGQFDWEKPFLEKAHNKASILEKMHALTTIKPEAQKALFTLWQANVTFEAHLRGSHG